MNERSRRQRAARAYLEWLVRHPWVILAITSLVTIVLAAGITHLEVYVDEEANLPSGHPWVQTDQEIQEIFGGRNICAVAFRFDNGTIWTPERLGLLVSLTRDVMALPDVIEENVFSIASPKAKDIVGTEEGFEVRRILDGPPETVAGVERVREAYRRNRDSLGPLIAPDGTAAQVSMDFYKGPGESEIYRRVRNLVDRYERRHPDVEFFLTGRPIFTHFFTENARKTQRYFFLALGMILVTLYLSFRSVQGTIIPILTGVSSVLWSLGLMGLLGIHMDGWNSMTPILILAVAAGHSVQILKRYYEEYARRSDVGDFRERNRIAVVESTYRIGLVMVVAGTVAAGGFLSLLVFHIPTIQTFGLFTALGILSAVVLELTFVPALRTVLPPSREPPKRAASRSDRWLWALGMSLARPSVRYGLYAGAVAVLGVSVFFTTRIEVNSSIRDYLPRTSDARIGAEMMEKDLGGVIPGFVLVEGEPGTLQDPDVLRWMSGLEEHLDEVESVTFTLSLANVVRRFHQAMHADDPAYDRIPEDPNLVAQYFFLYELSASPEDFSRFVTSDYSKGIVRVMLRSDRARDVERMTGAVSHYANLDPLPEGASMRIGGGGPVSLALDQTLTEGKIWNIILVTVMVYLLSSLILGSPAAGLFVVLPLLVAVALNFAALGAFGIWLNMATSTVAAMAVGIGADYAIYVTYRIREEYRRLGDAREATASALATSGKAVLFVATSISVGYASLGASEFYVNSILARLVPLSMIASCLVAITLMPAALLHVRPRFLFGHPSDKDETERIRAAG